jgi:hypothetical protein
VKFIEKLGSKRRKNMKERNDNVYNYVANNYYQMSREDLKNIILEALYLLGDESKLQDTLEEEFDMYFIAGTLM